MYTVCTESLLSLTITICYFLLLFCYMFSQSFVGYVSIISQLTRSDMILVT